MAKSFIEWVSLKEAAEAEQVVISFDQLKQKIQQMFAALYRAAQRTWGQKTPAAPSPEVQQASSDARAQLGKMSVRDQLKSPTWGGEMRGAGASSLPHFQRDEAVAYQTIVNFLNEAAQPEWLQGIKDRGTSASGRPVFGMMDVLKKIEDEILRNVENLKDFMVAKELGQLRQSQQAGFHNLGRTMDKSIGKATASSIAQQRAGHEELGSSMSGGFEKLGRSQAAGFERADKSIGKAAAASIAAQRAGQKELGKGIGGLKAGQEELGGAVKGLPTDIARRVGDRMAKTLSNHEKKLMAKIVGIMASGRPGIDPAKRDTVAYNLARIGGFAERHGGDYPIRLAPDVPGAKSVKDFDVQDPVSIAKMLDEFDTAHYQIRIYSGWRKGSKIMWHHKLHLDDETATNAALEAAMKIVGIRPYEPQLPKAGNEKVAVDPGYEGGTIDPTGRSSFKPSEEAGEEKII